ncbi:MAG: M23 family metallopeptidase [Clostridia bacterium]|nr:M23 family metallopeptidase [Clostridia bacterium]
MENNKKGRVNFLKRYGYYLFALVLVLGITLTIALAAVNKNTTKEPEVDLQTGTQAVVFGLPVNNPSVLKWYSDSELMYNETLKQWEAHKGIDIVSQNADNTAVYSVLDGVVTDIQDSYEFGTVVTISHSNGFVSVYSSLDSELDVQLSDNVSKGYKIGNMSQTASNEQKSGNHLHFELYKDGQKVDPSNYLSLENK